MATEAQKKELTEKVSKLVRDRFDGDYSKAFAHYDSDGDGRVSKDDLGSLLSDAGIGNWVTRGTWVAGIIAVLDTDKDGSISAAEFHAVLR